MAKQCQYHPLPAILTSPANVTLTDVHLPTILSELHQFSKQHQPC